MAEAAAVIGSVKEGVDAAKGVLDLYNQLMKTIVPWDAFNKTIKKLEEGKSQYSDKAAKVVGEVKTLLLNSKDVYDSASLEVYRWCKKSVPLLKNYLDLFQHTTSPDVAAGQKTLMMMVLKDGEDKMKSAMDRLERSKSSFNEASGKLQELKTVLDNDFSENSDYFKRACERIRTEAYVGAIAGGIFGPLGLAISYAIAAGTVEGDKIPELKKAFAETKKEFERLDKVVDNAMGDITNAKSDIDIKLKSINTIRAKIEEVKDFVKIWALIPIVEFQYLKKSCDELIDLCNQYVRAEDDKK